MVSPERIRQLPKAELHLHIEGSLEPELLFELAGRNDVTLPFASVADVRNAYAFTNLQSFLDIYYQGMGVLHTEQDFADLTTAYLDRAIADGVVHSEIFFDPQGHTERGISMETVVHGLVAGCEARRDRITTSLIMCFLRHLPEDDALATMAAAEPLLEHITGVGLDSSEDGFPPALFTRVFARAADLGLERVAHAGEEGPPANITSALDDLGVVRIDHGVSAIEDPAVIQRLAADQIPLTMCPLSNQRLQVTPNLADHPLKRLHDAGVVVTVNSDDPSYFGGYVVDNYTAIADALALTDDDIVQLARNSITASFLPARRKTELHAQIDALALPPSGKQR